MAARPISPQPPELADFGVEIDFAPSSGDPSRIFRTMAGLIEAFQDIDRNLIKSVHAEIQPLLVLEDVEQGSLRVWLSETLKSAVDDDALKDLSIRKQLGAYLVKGKYRLIKFLEGKKTISSRLELEDLQQQLLDDAKAVHAYPFPGYKAMVAAEIAAALRLITDATSHLTAGDSAEYLSQHGNALINLEFRMSVEEFDDLLTMQMVTNREHLVLQVKKPDYLGQSMWELRHMGHVVEAKLLDEEWLRRFQNREIELRPGDALDCEVQATIRYGYDAEVISAHYDVLEVFRVIRLDLWNQAEL